jgi:thioredoxin reductase (NADPH)
LIYDVVVIGAGPAGLTAGIYALRAGMSTLIIDCPSVISQAAYALTIENFPGFPSGISGNELISNMKKQASALGGLFLSGNVNVIEKSAEKGRGLWDIKLGEKQQRSLSVIVATGASAKKLDSKGEEKFLGKGVSYCAACDGIFFKDRPIAVVGGGDSAIEEALFLTRFARKVTIVHRRDRLRAVKLLQDRVFKNKKIDIAWNSIVDEILGDNRVLRLRIKDVLTGCLKDITCEGVFVSIGKNPNTYFLKGLTELDSQGYIVTDKGLQASQEGIFACGDCRDSIFKQIVTSCGDGALAAETCRQYIDALKGL